MTKLLIKIHVIGRVIRLIKTVIASNFRPRICSIYTLFCTLICSGCWQSPETCILWKYNPDGSRTCMETKLNPEYPGNR